MCPIKMIPYFILELFQLEKHYCTLKSGFNINFQVSKKGLHLKAWRCMKQERISRCEYSQIFHLLILDLLFFSEEKQSRFIV